jgi:hypothetical protein
MSAWALHSKRTRSAPFDVLMSYLSLVTSRYEQGYPFIAPIVILLRFLSLAACPTPLLIFHLSLRTLQTPQLFILIYTHASSHLYNYDWRNELTDG